MHPIPLIENTPSTPSKSKLQPGIILRESGGLYVQLLTYPPIQPPMTLICISTYICNPYPHTPYSPTKTEVESFHIGTGASTSGSDPDPIRAPYINTQSQTLRKNQNSPRDLTSAFVPDFILSDLQPHHPSHRSINPQALAS